MPTPAYPAMESNGQNGPDLRLLGQIHHLHRLHLAWVNLADGSPVTLTLDGDPAALVEALLRAAAFGQAVRAAAARDPRTAVGRLVRVLDAAPARNG